MKYTEKYRMQPEQIRKVCRKYTKNILGMNVPDMAEGGDLIMQDAGGKTKRKNLAGNRHVEKKQIDMEEVYRLLDTGMSVAGVAEKFGVTRRTLYEKHKKYQALIRAEELSLPGSSVCATGKRDGTGSDRMDRMDGTDLPEDLPLLDKNFL